MPASSAKDSTAFKRPDRQTSDWSRAISSTPLRSVALWCYWGQRPEVCDGGENERSGDEAPRHDSPHTEPQIAPLGARPLCDLDGQKVLSRGQRLEGQL